MAIIKNEIPILEFDTEQTAVLNPTHENLGLNLPKKCVFAFLGAYIDEYASKSDTKQVLLHSATDPQSISRPQALLPHRGHPYKRNPEQFYRTVSGFPSAFRADRISPISSSSFSIPFISSISLIVSLYCLESCGIVFGPSTASFAHISICFARISAKFSKRSKRLPSLVTVAIFLALPI